MSSSPTVEAAGAAEPAASAAPTGKPARRHVYEADVVRVLTFAAVIGVHTFSEATGGYSVGGNGVVMLLHFTREAFFVLTGFVLIHQYFGRPYSVRHFWARRFLTVGVPYVVWSVFYTGLHWYQSSRTMSFSTWLHLLWTYLINGQAWFHMYFLLVSMQIYLIFPLISGLIRLCAGHHGLLLGISAAVQLALMIQLTYAHPHAGLAAWYADRADISLLTYQFYVLLGAVVGVHLDETVAWVRRHRALVMVAFVATGITAELWYLVAARHQMAANAAAVLQPIMLPWSVAMVAALFSLGIFWSDHRRAGSRLDRTLRAASDRSFGIYLCHPAVLFAILWAGNGWLIHELWVPWLAIVAYVLTVIGAVAVTEVLRHAPFSVATTGRPRLPLRGPARTTGTTRSKRSTTGKDTTDVLDLPHPARPRPQAAPAGADDDDRRRATHSPVHRRAVELQRAD